jgi:hypothetical protein
MTVNSEQACWDCELYTDRLWADLAAYSHCIHFGDDEQCKREIAAKCWDILNVLDNIIIKKHWKDLWKS